MIVDTFITYSDWGSIVIVWISYCKLFAEILALSSPVHRKWLKINLNITKLLFHCQKIAENSNLPVV